MKKIVCLLFFLLCFNAYSSKCEDTISEAKQDRVQSKADSRERRPEDYTLPSGKDMLDPNRKINESRRYVVLDERGNTVSVSESKPSIFSRIRKKLTRD